MAFESKPKMSLHARRNIRDEYDKKIDNTLHRAQQYVGEPDLRFEPNFEENYAKLLALENTLERSEPDDNIKLHREWQETFGMKTREYFEGLVEKLQRDNFRGNSQLQAAFKAAVSAKVAVLRIVEEDMKGEPCDVVAQNGTLILRVALDQFGISPYHAPRGLEKVIDAAGLSGMRDCK